MTDLLEQAAADLRSSLSSGAPSVSELRARGQRRRRRQLAAGLVIAGLGAATAVARWPIDRDVVNVSAAQPDGEPVAPAPGTTASESGSPTTPGACVTMPNLIGMEQAQAMAALGQISSAWEEGERQSDFGPVGIVLDQTPAAGSSVCPDTRVAIIVSTAPYTVQPGDTYASIASAEGVDVETLLSVNARTLETPLIVGDQLIIPGRDNPPLSADPTSFVTIPTSTSVAPAGECLLYEVKSGDSFSSIATMFDLTLADLVGVNPGRDVLTPGDKVNIPYAGDSGDISQVICDADGNPTG